MAPTLEQNTWNCMRWIQLVKRRNWAGDRRQCIFRMSMIRRGRCTYVVCRSLGSKVCTDQQMRENYTNRRRLLTQIRFMLKVRNCDAGTISAFFQSENLEELVHCKHRSSFNCCLHVSFANCLRIGTEALNRRTDAAFVVDECGGQRFCGH